MSRVIPGSIEVTKIFYGIEKFKWIAALSFFVAKTFKGHSSKVHFDSRNRTIFTLDLFCTTYKSVPKVGYWIFQLLKILSKNFTWKICEYCSKRYLFLKGNELTIRTQIGRILGSIFTGKLQDCIFFRFLSFSRILLK